jgi:hypothetical protein
MTFSSSRTLKQIAQLIVAGSWISTSSSRAMQIFASLPVNPAKAFKARLVLVTRDSL